MIRSQKKKKKTVKIYGQVWDTADCASTGIELVLVGRTRGPCNHFATQQTELHEDYLVI